MRRAVLLLSILGGCEAGRLVIGDDPTQDDVAGVDTEVADTVVVDDSEPIDPGPDTDVAHTDDTPAVDACAPEDGVVPDLTQRGGLGVATSTGKTDVPGDCTVSWTRFVPKSGPAHSTAVLLSHGFQRAPAQVEGWARHLASHGFEVITPALCHSTIWDTDHAKDAGELVSLAEQLLGGRDVIFVGHSAGGLSSTIAGADSPQAVGVFGLDLVDVDDLAKKAAPRVGGPVWGLVGKPYTCNSDGNGRPIYGKAVDGRFLAITDASHCDFEDATDWVCTSTCEGPTFQSRVSDASQRATVRVLLTSFVMSLAGSEPDAIAYWTDGCAQREQLRSLGLVR
jgi:hypothetical protein